MHLRSKSAALALVFLAIPAAAEAQSVGNFYRGKTLNVYIGVGVGGEYDIQARLVARHIGKHIPGNPTVVPQNMTGAGGLRMINYLYNVAPKDGLSIGMIANAFPAMQAAGIAGVQFDAAKMNWIGSIAAGCETMAVWHTTGVKSIDDARKREVVAGASARGAITFIYPQMMNEFLGTKFKIVTGYTATTPGRVGRPLKPTGSGTRRSPSSRRRVHARPISMHHRSKTPDARPRKSSSSSWWSPARSLAGRWQPTRRPPNALRRYGQPSPQPCRTRNFWPRPRR
jgi:hypothetical protein